MGKWGFSFAVRADQLFLITALALLVGLGLTIISILGLCTQACAVGHHYRLFGFHFETIGLTFFSSALLLHLFSRFYPPLRKLVILMVASAIGAEVIFILVQKLAIGAWCPVCLIIAGCIAVAALALTWEYITGFRYAIQHNLRGKVMNYIRQSFSPIIAIFVGFLLTFVGISKQTEAQVAEATLKHRLIFGNANSHMEVYIFTDWQCPVCRQLEPMLDQVVPLITQRAKLIFVDLPIHPETLNFVPYNLSFILNNKKHYLELRRALTAISIQTKTPTDEQVERAAQALDIHYQQLQYAEVAAAIKYYKSLGKQFNVKATPTVLVLNTKSKKGKKLVGLSQITQETILGAMDALER